MSDLLFGRLVTAMITPFDEDRNIDLEPVNSRTA